MLSIHLNQNWNSINFEFKLSSCHWWVIYDVGAFECWCFTSENFNALTWDHACSRHQLIIFNWGSFVQILPQAEEKKKNSFPFLYLGKFVRCMDKRWINQITSTAIFGSFIFMKIWTIHVCTILINFCLFLYHIHWFWASKLTREELSTGQKKIAQTFLKELHIFPCLDRLPVTK